jgi:chemotaxis protein MotB
MELNLEPDDDVPVLQPKPKTSWLPWVVTLLVAGGGATYAVMQHQNHVDEARKTQAALVEAQNAAKTAIEREQAAQKALDDAKASLTTAQADLEKSSTQKTDDDKLIAQLKGELGGGNGDVAGSGGGAITVTMVDKILFKPGEADLTPEGEKVLAKLGGAIKESGKLVEVSGHADNTPVKSEVKALYPTNWELSTSRATHVVRFLTEQAGVPAKMLKAAGYGSARPVASNATPAGRAKNRRIEILLLPEKVKVVKGELPATASAAPAVKKPTTPEMSDKDRIKALQAAKAAPPPPAKVATAKTKKKK